MRKHEQAAHDPGAAAAKIHAQRHGDAEEAGDEPAKHSQST